MAQPRVLIPDDPAAQAWLQGYLTRRGIPEASYLHDLTTKQFAAFKNAFKQHLRGTTLLLA